MSKLQMPEIKTHSAINLNYRAVRNGLRKLGACQDSRAQTRGMDARKAWAHVRDHSWFCWFYAEVGKQYIPMEEYRAVVNAFEQRYAQCRERFWKIWDKIMELDEPNEEYRKHREKLQRRWRQWYAIWNVMYCNALRSLITWEDEKP